MSYFEKNYTEINYPLSNDENKGLRKAQLGAIHSIASHFTINEEPVVITMPTGSGKTAVLMMSAFVLCAKRVLVITPSRLVRTQIFDDFRTLKILKKLKVIGKGIEPPRVFEVESKIKSIEAWNSLGEYEVVVGTPNSISPAFEEIPEPPEGLFDLLLVDEAHHSPARTWRTILSTFQDSRKILFTATPFRKDQKEIKGNFIYTYPLREAYNDKIFSKIAYISVRKQKGVADDLLVAKKAESIFKKDKNAGFSHFLMVRTDSKKRAKELKHLYEDNTSLKLKSIHSGHTYRHIKSTITQLRAGRLDGIICVAMLGEGFDLPSLKIAAIHAPHRSLEVTLQFIGRFARSSGHKIGEAKFIAVPQDIEIETKKLYSENAIWQDIVANLSQSRIEREQKIREDISKFEEAETNDIKIEDISLYSLQPYFHVKIYEVQGTIDISKDIELPPNFEVVYKSVSHDLNAVIYLTKEVVKPKWSTLSELSKIEYDLFIVYYNSVSNLIFINTTRRIDSIYEHIAHGYSDGKHRILSLYKINKVLLGLDGHEFFNIGMKNRNLSSNTESYRIIAGANVHRALDNSDGLLYHRGHVFGKASANDKKLTIGYSSASKVWSNTNSKIPELIEWCQELSQKLVSFKQPKTNTGLDYLTVGTEVTQVPEGVIAAEWDPSIYKKPPGLTYTGEDNLTRTVELIDLDLIIERESTSAQKIRVVIEAEEFESHVEFSPNSFPYFSKAEKLFQDATVDRGNSKIGLIEYLNQYPLHFYFSDFSRMRCDELFSFDSSEIGYFSRDRITSYRWDGVNIENEAKNEGTASIHSHLADRIKDEFPVVFYDHGTGEIADFIGVNEESSKIKIVLYHCKASGGPKPGDRVDDVYEVCGQAVKCLKWIDNNTQLFARIKSRYEKTSEFVKGDFEILKEIFENTASKSTTYKVVMVQPGISKKNLSDKLARILASASDYLRKAKSEPLEVISSE